MSDFVHIDVKTVYSRGASLVHPGELVRRATELELPAVAVTDYDNLAGAYEIYWHARSYDIKPILGCSLRIHPKPARGRFYFAERHRLKLLARNFEGWRSLIALNAAARITLAGESTPIDGETLANHAANLVVVASPWPDGTSLALGGSSEIRRAKPVAEALVDLVPKGQLFLGVSAWENPTRPGINEGMRQLGSELDIPLVATNPVCFLQPEEWETYLARYFFDVPRLDSTSFRKMVKGALPHYLLTAEQMREAMPAYVDAIENTLEVADLCAPFNPVQEHVIPDLSPNHTDPDDALADLARDALKRRVPELGEERGELTHTRYTSRLNKELRDIAERKYSSYFLLLTEIVEIAKSRSIPLGPGRGAAPGSLVCYALGLTDVDPLQYDLVFERFLNIESMRMPLVYVEVGADRRDELILGIVRRFGSDSVAAVSVQWEPKARKTLLSVGRAMGVPLSISHVVANALSDDRSDLNETGTDVPYSWLATSIPESQDEIDAICRSGDQRDDAERLVSIAAKVQRVGWKSAPHPHDLLLDRGRVCERTPTFDCTDNPVAGSIRHVTQLDHTHICLAGLIPVYLNATAVPPDNGEPIPLDDPTVYQSLGSGEVDGIPGLESEYSRDLLIRLQPHRIGHLAAVIALHRPSPLKEGLLDDYIATVQGHREPEYLHTSLEPILRETYGLLIYQEQVMQILRELAGHTLEFTDELRRTFCKRKYSLIERYCLEFLARAEDRGLSVRDARDIFKLLKERSPYTFNKAHAIAEAIRIYRFAWLKLRGADA